MSYFKIIKNEEDVAMVHHSKTHERVLNWHGGMAQFIRDKILKKDINVSIDIGASYGWFTLPFISYSKEVHCFEMRKDVFECLKLNMSEYNNIHCYNKALSDKNDKLYYNINKDKDVSGMTRIVSGGEHEVECKTLDSYLIKNVDLIKIDVEGHQIEVLKGAKDTISKYRPVIIVEGNLTRGENSYNVRNKMYEYFNTLDYKIFDIWHNDFIYIPN
mgnify:FL=1